MKTELEAILGIYKDIHHGELTKDGFKKCYQVFSGGLEEFKKKHPDEDEFIRVLALARTRHEHPMPMKILSNQMRKEFSPVAHLYFNYKPFSGHASRLGHYFRHLYLTVKSVANSKVVTVYEEKMKYLTLLRAQLSNHEQILLFYNWLSGYGGAWENNKHAFLSDYDENMKDAKGKLVIGMNVDETHYPYSVLGCWLSSDLFDNRYLKMLRKKDDGSEN